MRDTSKKGTVMDFWDFVWLIVISFALVAYLMVLFSILTDLFRDHALNGWLKAVWIIALIFFPFLTALVYVIARGKGMAERQAGSYEDAKKQQEAYIKSVAGEMSPADEIAKAKSMYDAGTITEAEYQSLKKRALV
jgi:Short C-terminal domain/Phospholipase_D-nuclease N-terminal